MDASPIIKEIKPRTSKQSFNILLHQALDEESEQKRGDTGEQRVKAIPASPLSCPNNPIDKVQPWGETFSAVIAKKVVQPAPEAAAGPVRVKYSRHKKNIHGLASDPSDKSAPSAEVASCILPSYDSMEAQRKMMIKLHRGNSLSDAEVETDDLEELRARRRQRRTQTLKQSRVRMLGAFDLSAKFSSKK